MVTPWCCWSCWCRHPGAIAAAGRRRLPLPRLRPRHIGEVRHDGDLVVTVCDLAHEELAEATAVHWSVPDPVPAGDPGSFDAALAQLAGYVVAGLAARMIAECMPGAASWVKVTDVPVNPAAASPSRYSARDRAPAMHPA